MNQTLNTKCNYAAWIMMAIMLLVVLKVHLLPALLSGLMVYELVYVLTPLIERHVARNRAKFLAVVLLATSVIGLLTLGVMGVLMLLRSDAGSLSTLVAQMAEIVEDSRRILPPWLNEHLPQDAFALQQMVTDWLRTHSNDLQFVGKEAGHHAVHMLIAMVIGAMVAVHDSTHNDAYKPFANSLVRRIELFSQAFRNIVFAQIRISAINAALTGIYLALILPMLDIHLPFAKTLILITFVVGLLPVVGNLISNTAIVIVSMSISLSVALGSLVFLVVIHKLEYFLNARIVGTQIRAHAWELLIAMLTMEAAFGLPGIVAAPIYYAYIKSELKAQSLI